MYGVVLSEGMYERLYRWTLFNKRGQVLAESPFYTNKYNCGRAFKKLFKGLKLVYDC